MRSAAFRFETANITAALERHGYTPSQIAKLWGDVLRIWQAAIDARAPSDPRKVRNRG